MSCPFAGLATRYTIHDERVSVRICSAVPYERDSDPEDLPLPSVCFSQVAWQSCPHYLRLTQRKEVALEIVQREQQRQSRTQSPAMRI